MVYRVSTLNARSYEQTAALELAGHSPALSVSAQPFLAVFQSSLSYSRCYSPDARLHFSIIHRNRVEVGSSIRYTGLRRPNQEVG